MRKPLNRKFSRLNICIKNFLFFKEKPITIENTIKNSNRNDISYETAIINPIKVQALKQNTQQRRGIKCSSTRENLQRSESIASNYWRRSSAGNSRRQSIPILHSGAMFRNGIMQLMSQTLDPLTEGICKQKIIFK